MTANIPTAAENSPGYLPIASAPVSREASRRVSLFRNGANQAVRIPREFELPGTEARLRREGDRLILEPVEAASLHELIRAWETEPPLEEDIPEFPDESPEPVSF